MNNRPDIPWHLIASNLHWAPGKLTSKIRALNLPHIPGKLKEEEGCECGFTNLHKGMNWDDFSGLNEVAEAFSNAVKESSAHKQTDWLENNRPPDPSEIILGDELFQRINSLLSDEEKGGPRLPYEQRKASAFLQPAYLEDDDNSRNKIASLNRKVVNTLVILGEVDPIIRACEHPDVARSYWHLLTRNTSQEVPYDLEWGVFLGRALIAYIALNIIRCFPEIWDPESCRTDETDYRHTRIYQIMLRRVTETRWPSGPTVYPHNQFFGIPRDHFVPGGMSSRIDKQHWLRRTDIFYNHFGVLSFDKFLNLEGEFTKRYLPLESDVESVRQILFLRGLPMEIVFMIMNFADYKTERALKVPHDPLHPSNRAEMNHYLDECWKIIIGCDILFKVVCGREIDWSREIREIVQSFFCNTDDEMFRWKT